MRLQAVEPRRLYRQIADQLRKLIGKGQLATGPACPPSASWRGASACRAPACARR
jgi:DNA-binding transcriptional MocR family regulator